jgi:predicted HAD superfamily Cof-like phosphohydrolase
MSLEKMIQDVGRFHESIGAPIAVQPTLLHRSEATCHCIAKALRDVVALCQSSALRGNDLLARVGMAAEELAEWVEAHEQSDLVAAADAWGDRFYVLLGDAVATGLPAAEIFAEVHRSNMSKAQADATGKGRKDTGYRKPEIAALLHRRSAHPTEMAP